MKHDEKCELKRGLNGCYCASRAFKNDPGDLSAEVEPSYIDSQPIEPDIVHGYSYQAQGQFSFQDCRIRSEQTYKLRMNDGGDLTITGN